jgi:hypothetical protein
VRERERERDEQTEEKRVLEKIDKRRERERD